MGYASGKRSAIIIDELT